ncbi:DMT family transporter [Ideonella sp. BN130291]|uniref:DMT family transporter n=1 Tax=Ideonella sp. BN130291 TaxID=3112940 RepID=UPI002E266604|nr:DMT family transporter [Ideonella sp. BN130291]
MNRRLSGPPAMLLAMLLFSTMGACVKLASAWYSAGEIVFYRSIIASLVVVVVMRRRGTAVGTQVPGLHFTRSGAGAVALGLFFYGITGLPLATAITLNYTSSVWMAFFLVAMALASRSARPDVRLVAAVLLGFVGAALVLQPSLGPAQWRHGLAGLLSGVVAAVSYLQVARLSRLGEPDERIVFYFSLSGIVVGAAMAFGSGWHGHTLPGVALLLAVGVLAAFAQTLLTRAYASGNPLVSGSLQYTGIVFSSLYGLLLFHDSPSWPWALGVVLIVVSGCGATWLRSRPAAA